MRDGGRRAGEVPLLLGQMAKIIPSTIRTEVCEVRDA